MKKHSPGKSLTVVFLAVVLLTIMSAVDWRSVSGGRINNFSLIEDIYIKDVTAEQTLNEHLSSDLIDPALISAIDDVTSEIELPVHNITSDHLAKDIFIDTISTITKSVPLAIISDSVCEQKPLITPKRIYDILPIEDYTSDGRGLKRLAWAIAHCSDRRARIAVIGDSYIEGDIFTQDVRSLLQSEYGGRGVGYMSMHSDFPGFRRSVNQSDKDWTVVDMRNNTRDELKPLSGEYCVGSNGSTTTFKGSKLDHADKWSSSTIVFIAPSSGIIKITTDDGPQDIPVEKSESIQVINLESETSKAVFSSQINGLKILGAWLEDNHGIGVDCMSLRGNSGVTHRQLAVTTAKEMNEFIPYDLIVVEYGLNALSAKQSDYTSYSRLMVQVINRLKECYPDADIMMLGVGDRGSKNGSSVNSMKTVEAMVDAQRKCARDCEILFWDTREAMGGEGAIVDWRQRGLVNADYIHLNHKGGAELAKEFVKALKLRIDESL